MRISAVEKILNGVKVIYKRRPWCDQKPRRSNLKEDKSDNRLSLEHLNKIMEIETSPENSNNVNDADEYIQNGYEANEYVENDLDDDIVTDNIEDCNEEVDDLQEKFNTDSFVSTIKYNLIAMSGI